MFMSAICAVPMQGMTATDMPQTPPEAQTNAFGAVLTVALGAAKGKDGIMKALIPSENGQEDEEGKKPGISNLCLYGILSPTPQMMQPVGLDAEESEATAHVQCQSRLPGEALNKVLLSARNTGPSYGGMAVVLPQSEDAGTLMDESGETNRFMARLESNAFMQSELQSLTQGQAELSLRAEATPLEKPVLAKVEVPAGQQPMLKPLQENAVPAPQQNGETSAQNGREPKQEKFEALVKGLAGKASLRQQVTNKADGEFKPQLSFETLSPGTAPMRPVKVQAAAETAAVQNTQDVSAAMQVAKATVKALKEGTHEYHIQLSPEGLGKVTVTMLAKDKALSLSIRADQSITRELILGQIGELKAELGASEFHLSGLHVEVDVNGQGSAGFSAFSQGQGNQAFEQKRWNVPFSDAAPALAQPVQALQMRYAAESGIISYRI